MKSCELVKEFQNESTSSSLKYNLDSFFGFKKEASGLTLESSSFLKHVEDISQKETAKAAADVLKNLVATVSSMSDGVPIE